MLNGKVIPLFPFRLSPSSSESHPRPQKPSSPPLTLIPSGDNSISGYFYSFKERRRLGDGRYVCWSCEDKKKERDFSNEIDDDCVDEVKLLLDLLIEEVGLESIVVSDRKRVQKKDPSNISGRTKPLNSRSVKRDLKCDSKYAEIQSSEKENRKLSNEGKTFVKGENHDRKNKGQVVHLITRFLLQVSRV